MTVEQKTQIQNMRNAGFGYGKIAQMLAISENTVKSYCRRNGLKNNTSPNIGVPDNTVYCRNCGKSINIIKGRKKKCFCSDECRKDYWKNNQSKIVRKTAVEFVCAVCGQHFSDYKRNNRKYCSHECYTNDRYKGGGINE